MANRQNNSPPMITKKQAKLFEEIFNYYNRELFQNKLQECLISMSRKAGKDGSFKPDKWIDGQKKHIHEILLHPQILEHDSAEWHAVIVRNMVFLWQHIYGSPSRAGYLNAECAGKMERIGLIPSSTGKPGGEKVGQKVSHYIGQNSLFIKAHKKLRKKENEYKPAPAKHKESDNKKNKITYRCPLCGASTWAKPSSSFICGKCYTNYNKIQFLEEEKIK